MVLARVCREALDRICRCADGEGYGVKAPDKSPRACRSDTWTWGSARCHSNLRSVSALVLLGLRPGWSMMAHVGQVGRAGAA